MEFDVFIKLPVRARMALFVDFLEPFDGDMGVNLRGRETGMAQQFLDAPQVGPGVQQVRRETVAQGMRGNARC